MTTRTLIIATAVILAFALALYLGQAWPLKALAWAENMAPAVVVGSKALAKAVVILGTASGMLWAGFAARRK
jgi:hypothetical protein